MATMDLGRVRGNDGVGVPSGGTAGQVLAKASSKDNDTKWIDPPAGGGSSVEIDATLKVPGKAADAKATGDALNQLSQQIVEVDLEQANDAGEVVRTNADMLGGMHASAYATKNDLGAYATKNDLVDFATKTYANGVIVKRTLNSGVVTKKPADIMYTAPEGYKLLTVTGVRSNGYTLPAYALYNDNLVQVWWLADIDYSAITITFDVDVLFVRK